MLKHMFAPKMAESFYADVDSISSLVTAISRHAEKYGKDEDEKRKIKGDAFEVFGEYLIKRQGGNNNIPIDRDTYMPGNPDEDYGVDGVGVYNGQPVTVQLKYRSNPSDAITYEEVSKFRTQSDDRFDIPKNRFGECLLITTAFDFNQHVKDSGTKRPYLINREALAAIVGNSSDFWNGFRDAIKAAHLASIKTKKHRELFSHQKEAVEAISVWYAKPFNKGIVNIPTGGGKTLIAFKAIQQAIVADAKVCVVVAPRINLSNQIGKDFYAEDACTAKWNHVSFNSGDGVEVDRFQGEEPVEWMSTLNPEVVTKMVGEKPLVIYTTYHSCEKLVSALREKSISVDMMVCDEAHNLVTPEFNRYVMPGNAVTDNTKKTLYFTATNRRTEASARGMENSTLFGEVVHQTEPKALMEAGHILPPRMAVVKVKSSDQDLDNVDEAQMLHILEESVKQYTEHFVTTSSKIIVTCKSADQAAYLCNQQSHVLDSLGYKRYLVLSDPEKRGGKNPKAELDRFTEDSGRAIIFHYDMIGEGIDVPGVTAVLILRNLKEIKATQTIGRTLRLAPTDRKKVELGELKGMRDPHLWEKPCGYIIVPVDDDELYSSEAKARIAKIVCDLREYGYDFGVERLAWDHRPTSKDDMPEVPCLQKKPEGEPSPTIDSIEFLVEEMSNLYTLGSLRIPDTKMSIEDL